MKKFIVFIAGKNLLIKDEKEVIQNSGFYTTRFINADNSSHAKSNSLTLIREELNGIILNDFSNPPVIEVNELNEVDSFGDNQVPGAGFTWYIEDS